MKRAYGNFPKKHHQGKPALIVIALFYGYIFYVERKSFSAEKISIQHQGITVTGFPFDRFIPWIEINRIEADHPDFIIFLRNTGRKYHFSILHHLKLKELEYIQSYCRHYIPQKP